MEDEVYNYEATMSPLAAIAMGRIQKVISEEEFDAFVEKNEELYQSPIRAMMLFAAEATKSYHFLQAHLEANDLKLMPEAQEAMLAAGTICHELWENIEMSLAPEKRN